MSAELPTAGRPAGSDRTAVERRRTLRVEAKDVEVILQIGTERLIGDVLDVSRGGLRIKAKCPPIIGDRLTVRHAAAGTLSGVCVRQNADEIAIAFDPAESEVERTLQCLALLLDQTPAEALADAASKTEAAEP
ncbi:PilZ domain-containing protein [Algihabitans albus]|uniref:PilZ domain-containing protein n=1 Tax=Algihabitans albus TaxID=2164067 RepID=UPI0013C2EE53|nr:PilZ domain-containing protein [Algihabitans albus]